MGTFVTLEEIIELCSSSSYFNSGRRIELKAFLQVAVDAARRQGREDQAQDGERLLLSPFFRKSKAKSVYLPTTERRKCRALLVEFVRPLIRQGAEVPPSRELSSLSDLTVEPPLITSHKRERNGHRFRIPVQDDRFRPCHVCSRAARSRCGDCHQVVYCGRVCQIGDWSKHSRECNKKNV